MREDILRYGLVAIFVGAGPDDERARAGSWVSWQMATVAVIGGSILIDRGWF